MGLPNRVVSSVTSTVTSAIADGVWDEARSGHATTGTYGAGIGAESIIKTITYADGAGTGAVGNVVVATITGRVEIVRIVPRCTTDLVGASQITLGTVDDTDQFIAATLGTLIDTNKYWLTATDITDDLAIPAALKETVIDSNIVNEVASAAVSAGVIAYEIVWRPVSSGATLV